MLKLNGVVLRKRIQPFGNGSMPHDFVFSRHPNRNPIIGWKERVHLGRACFLLAVNDFSDGVELACDVDRHGVVKCFGFRGIFHRFALLKKRFTSCGIRRHDVKAARLDQRSSERNDLDKIRLRLMTLNESRFKIDTLKH